MYWIYDYPPWIIGPLFVATFIAVTWIGIFLTRATVHGWLHRDEHANEMVSSALANYFVLFGILLGLLAVAIPELCNRWRYCRQGGLEPVRVVSRR
jgi:hypothetical protein